MAPHSSTLAWKIPWMEEPGGLPSLGSHRVGHDWSDLAATAEGWDGGGGGERLKREGIYVYIKLIQVVVQQKLTQHCKATIFQKKFLRKQKKMARYIIVVSRAGSVYIWCKSIENLTERSSQIEVSGFQEQARIGKSKNKQPGLLGWFGWYFWGLGSSSVFLLQLEAVLLFFCSLPPPGPQLCHFYIPGRRPPLMPPADHHSHHLRAVSPVF